MWKNAMGGLVMALSLMACGSDDGNGGSGSSACYDLCDAQQAAEEAGNCPGVGLSLCRQLCDATRNADCADELGDLHECSLTGEFSCGIISAESDADCDAENAAYNACQNDSGAACVGANDAGFCPSVTCGCPDGEQRLSGTITDGAGCMCADESNCQQFCF